MEIPQVDSIQVLDSSSVKIGLKAPFAPFLFSLFDWAAFIASPTAVEKLGQDFGVKPVGMPWSRARYSPLTGSPVFSAAASSTAARTA